VRKVIEQLQKAYDQLNWTTGESEDDNQCITEAMNIIEGLIGELKAPPRWETPEQRKERTGEDWPEGAAVFTRLRGKVEPWDISFYGKHKQAVAFIERIGGNTAPIDVVCATEAGKPPDGWVPEGEE
jgi:hypothetical protein